MKVLLFQWVTRKHLHRSNIFQKVLLFPALVLLCSAVNTPAQEAKPEQKSVVNTPTQPQSQMATDDLVINDNNRLPCVYNYGQGGSQNNIYCSRRDYDQVNQHKNLNSVIFYLAPIPEIDTVELKRVVDVAPKIVVESAGMKLILKQVKLPGIPILTDERKMAAVREINRYYKLKGDAAVSIEQVRLAPYRSLEVVARLKNGRTLGTSRVDHTQGLERFFRIDLLGTDDELKQFVEDPTFSVRFQSHGFIAKVNELNVSLQLFFNEGFHHFLTGEADFKAWQKANMSNKSLGFSLPPLFFLRSNSGKAEASRGLKSWVTREQTHEVVSAFTTHIRVNRIVEFSDDTSLVNITEGILKTLLQEKDKITVFFRANVDQGNKITFYVFDRDLAPDLISDIGQKTILKNKTELGKDVSVTFSGTEKGINAKNDQKSNNDDSLEFGEEGGNDKIYVPKSIKLYQVALNTMASSMKFSVKDVRMTLVDNVPQSTSAHYVGYQYKTMRAILVHSRRVNGKELKLVEGDHCIGIADGEPADISFQANTSHSKKTIDIGIEYMVKETNDETTYKGKEVVSFLVPDEWKVVKLEGDPTTSYAITNQKLMIRKRSVEQIPLPFNNLNSRILPEVNASEIQFTRNEKGAPSSYIPTLSNPKNARGGGPLSKTLTPVDLKGTHLSSFILKLDTSDSGGKKDVVAAAIGYDLKFDIPYRAVRRVVASEPEHLKKLLAETK